MKALETIKEHIKDLERMKGVFTFYGCFSSASECKKASKELKEAVAEIESEWDKSCDLCKSRFCSVKRILIENDEINTSYFYCNDYEPKEQ